MKPQTADIREVAENHLLQMEQVIRRQHHSTDASFIGSTFNLSIIHRQPHSSSAPFIGSTSRRLSQLPSVEGDHAPGLRTAFDGYVDCDFSFQAGGGAWTFERNLQRLTLSTDTFVRAQVETGRHSKSRGLAQRRRGMRQNNCVGTEMHIIAHTIFIYRYYAKILLYLRVCIGIY